MKPNVWVVGSSAGIAGLLVASYIIDVKKTVIAFLALSGLVVLMLAPVTEQGLETIVVQQEKTLNQTQQNVTKLNETIKQVEKEIQEKQEKGENVTEIIQKKENLTSQLQEKQKEYQKVAEEKQGLEGGIQEEAQAEASWEIHALGALVSLCYLALFKKEAFQWLVKDVKDIARRVEVFLHIPVKP
jgi:vacuolar-type H+-ATPase subunit I/STV1